MLPLGPENTTVQIDFFGHGLRSGQRNDFQHRLIIALFDWGRKWPPLEMVIYTSNFTAQTTMYVDFYNCLVF